MNRKLWFCAVVLGSLSCPALAVEEPFCQPPDDCTNDLLSIRFADGTSELNNATVGQEITANVFLDINTPKVTGTQNCPQPPAPPECDFEEPQPPITECSLLQGFSYGVKHDTALLDIVIAQRPPVGANPGDPVRNADFNTTRTSDNLLGMISGVAVTIDACPPFDLPPEAKNLQCAVIRYKVKAAIPAAGTKLQFTSELNPPKSPPTPVSLTYAGKSKRPKTVNNAIIKGGIPPECTQPAHAFYFGPTAVSTAFDIANGNSVKVSMRNTNTSLGFSLGIKKDGAALTFVGNLGVPEPRELAIVTMQGTPPVLVEVAGAQTVGNSAGGAPTNPISGAVRGAAIAANQSDDFFGMDLITGVEDPDGVGVTVGYVSDRLDPLDKVIPAVADAGGACGANNEILTVNFGGPIPTNFSRGDANGDRKLNVTDGVIIAQNLFANRFVFFNCQDMLDADDNGTLNAADPLYLLTYLFLRGPVLAPPFKTCGPDVNTTGDTLACVAANCTP